MWAPECESRDHPEARIRVHRLPGHFGPRALAIMDRAIGRANGHRILVQYVPHAFGFKAMNLPFCYWLYARRKRGISVMFHEVAFPRRRVQPLRHNLLGEVTSLMATMVARSARRIYVSTPAWEGMLRPVVGLAKAIGWLPVPSTVPLINDLEATQAIRAKYAAENFLVGHFGTYGRWIREFLEVVIPAILEDGHVRVILLGRSGITFRETMIRSRQEIADRLYATDALTSRQVSAHLSACDLMIQPYPDGITTRRTSAMAALSHGRPVVTTAGRLTEPLWSQSGAVAMVSADNSLALALLALKLLKHPLERQRLGQNGVHLYQERFDLRHTINALRAADTDRDNPLVQP